MCSSDLAKASKLAAPIIAAGGKLHGRQAREALEKVNALSEKVNAWVHERVATWLTSDKIVGLVGGDHSVSFGAIKACAEKYPGLGILHVDAHAGGVGPHPPHGTDHNTAETDAALGREAGGIVEAQAE